MTSAAAESDDDSTIDLQQVRQNQDFLSEQKQRIGLQVVDVPFIREPLQTKLDSFTPNTLTDNDRLYVSEIVDRAIELSDITKHYEQELNKLIDPITIKNLIKYFWESFDFSVLENPQGNKSLTEELLKIVEGYREAQSTSEKVEDVIPEEKKFTPYFTTRERESIYKQYKRIREAANLNPEQKNKAENELQLKIAQKTLKRQAFKDKKLAIIAKKKTDIAYCEKQFSLLQRECGERVFELPEVKALHDEVMIAKEAEAELKDARSDFDAAVAKYTKRVGQAPPKSVLRFIPPSANENKAPEEEDNVIDLEQKRKEKEQNVTESYESAEMKIRVVTQLRQEAENAAKHWAQMAQDRQHARRGVGTTLFLLEGGAIDGYTREQYEKEFKNARDLPFSKPYQASTGRKVPQLFYDLPTNADAFSASMASSTAAMIKNARENLSEKGRAAASLFYNDYYKDQDPNTIAPSIHEFISSCHAMVHQLKAGKTVEDLPQAA